MVDDQIKPKVFYFILAFYQNTFPVIASKLIDRFALYF